MERFFVNPTVLKTLFSEFQQLTLQPGRIKQGSQEDLKSSLNSHELPGWPAVLPEGFPMSYLSINMRTWEKDNQGAFEYAWSSVTYFLPSYRIQRTSFWEVGLPLVDCFAKTKSCSLSRFTMKIKSRLTDLTPALPAFLVLIYHALSVYCLSFPCGFFSKTPWSLSL